jgi:hypothetical protein
MCYPPSAAASEPRNGGGFGEDVSPAASVEIQAEPLRETSGGVEECSAKPKNDEEEEEPGRRAHAD